MKSDVRTLRVKVPMIDGWDCYSKPIFEFKYCLPAGSDWHRYLLALPKQEADEKRLRLCELVRAETLTF